MRIYLNIHEAHTMTNIEKLFWIPNYLGLYKISKSGRIYSVERTRLGKARKSIAKVRGRYLKPSSARGYPMVGLYKDSASKKYTIHKLMCTTFMGGVPIGMQVNHKNGVKTDNRLRNLEIVSPGYNTRHAWKAGLCRRVVGEDNSNSKLKTKDVRYIKRLLRQGVSQCEIGRRFGRNPVTIWHIANNSTWKHVN